jgi:hypothetical protein
MTNSEKEFVATFGSLKNLLKPYEKHLKLTINKKDNYCLDAGYYPKIKRDLFFGSVQIKKNYVSFYLMPVYINPELLDGISPELKKRMQGKSCFNFKVIDKARLAELSKLAKKGFEFYKTNNML